MMNDRFDAQLRQHFVGTADERPAEGQLADLAQALAGTTQRHPISARLTWFSGRVGPIPSAGLRYGLVVLALVAAGVAVVILGGASKPSETVVVSPTHTALPTATPTEAPTALPPSADPQCIQFDSEGTYTANVGTLPVGVTVPGTASAPWMGERDHFFLLKAPCGSSGPLWFDAALVAHVYADACRWQSSSVEVPTAFDAAAALETQQGHDTAGPTDTRIGAFRATRLDFSVPTTFDDGTCDGGVITLWGDKIIVPGTTVQVYVAEVDGVTLVVTANYHTEDATPALLDEIDAILATLRVDM
jgi:hypothetical protein